MRKHLINVALNKKHLINGALSFEWENTLIQSSVRKYFKIELRSFKIFEKHLKMWLKSYFKYSLDIKCIMSACIFVCKEKNPYIFIVFSFDSSVNFSKNCHILFSLLFFMQNTFREFNPINIQCPQNEKMGINGL